MNKVIFLKLGGSLVTDKRKAYIFNESMVKQVVSEITECLIEQPDLKLVLGNGAGSFAHQSATKYNLKDGAKEKEGRFGACFTHTDASYLNHLIIKLFLQQNIPVFSVQPSAFILSSQRETTHIDFSIIKALMTHSMIPFVYGDVIVDEKLGAVVYSTDRIFREMAEGMTSSEYAPSLIIHAGNYDGVMDQNGKIIPHVTRQNYDEVKKSLYKSDVIDITGGMEQKVEEMLSLADHGINSVIINGKKKGNMKSTILGDISSGTYIST
ncbi:isopentenyl phosphate kinase [soil metagenome]